MGPGGQTGSHKLLPVLGEGGYGIVYLAEQQRPVKRRVALKVIKPRRLRTSGTLTKTGLTSFGGQARAKRACQTCSSELRLVFG